MDDRRDEARAEGGRRFQRQGAITAKDLDMAMVDTKPSGIAHEVETIKFEPVTKSRCILVEIW